MQVHQPISVQQSKRNRGPGLIVTYHAIEDMVFCPGLGSLRIDGPPQLFGGDLDGFFRRGVGFFRGGVSAAGEEKQEQAHADDAAKCFLEVLGHENRLLLQ